MGKFIEKLSMENIQSFFKLFNGYKCENCQCVSSKDANYLKDLLQRYYFMNKILS